MTAITSAPVWHEYYNGFSYMNEDEVRPLCHPGKLVHDGGSDRAIVLVHGLSDSPYSVLAIGNYFFHQLGYDVYLPLLQCHGLKDANGMRGVQLSAWKKNMQFAIDAALQGGRRVSLGGLSTGGALAFHFITKEKRLTGELYLFSGAFALYGGVTPCLGPLLEAFLRQPFIPYLTSGFSLIDDNPYRYSRVPAIAARELVFLMDENRALLEEIDSAKTFSSKVFSAWSESDRVVRTDVLEELRQILPNGSFTSYIIPKSAEVTHASVVLSEPVYAVDAEQGSPPIEKANPYFSQMLELLASFEKSSRK